MPVNIPRGTLLSRADAEHHPPADPGSSPAIKPISVCHQGVPLPSCRSQ